MKVRVFRVACCLIGLSLGLAWVGSARAQSRFGDRAVGGVVSGVDRGGGLTQEGQISSSAAIQRDAGAFVGSSGAGNIRSQTANGGLGGAVGLGAGLNLGRNLTSGLGGLGGGGLGGFGGGGLGGGFGGGFNQGQFGRGGQQNGRGGVGQTNQNRTPLRAPLSIGFTQAPTSTTVVSSRFSRRLDNLPGIQLRGPVSVQMEGRTAVLRGIVTSENDRDLVGRLALLEPGISEVQNELTIVANAAPR